MLQLSQGDIIVNGTDERKVLGICGEAVLVSMFNRFEDVYRFYTPTELERAGWSLKKKKWEPEMGRECYLVNSDGDIGSFIWNNTNEDNRRLIFGNCFGTHDEAEAHSDKIRALKE